MAEPVKVGDMVWVTAKSRLAQAQGVVVSSDEEGGWALVEHDGVEKGPFGWGWGELILRDKVQHPVAWSQTVLDKIEETKGQGWTTLVRVREGYNLTDLIFVGLPSVHGFVWWRIEIEVEAPTVDDGTGRYPPLVPSCGDAHLFVRGGQILSAPGASQYAPAVKRALDLLQSFNGGPAVTCGDDHA